MKCVFGGKNNYPEQLYGWEMEWRCLNKKPHLRNLWGGVKVCSFKKGKGGEKVTCNLDMGGRWSREFLKKKKLPVWVFMGWCKSEFLKGGFFGG